MAGDQRNEIATAGGVAVNWWAQYVGREFRGRSECWSLVCDVYRDHLGLDLPAHGDVSADYVAAIEGSRFGFIPREQMVAARRAVMQAFEAGQAAECWHPVDTPQEFDVVLMGGSHADRHRIMHVGVAVDPLRVLHIEKLTGAVVVPMTHPTVTGRIVGYRRHVTCSKS